MAVITLGITRLEAYLTFLKTFVNLALDIVNNDGLSPKAGIYAFV